MSHHWVLLFVFLFLFCLYETQDEDFIRSVMFSTSTFRLKESHTGHLWMDRKYSKQLNYLLTTLKTESFKTLCFECLTVDPECQKKLSPLLHRCQEVSFQECAFQSRYGKAILELRRKYCVNILDPADLSFLIDSESNIQELSLRKCDLTSSCCDVLRSILITNRSLTKLDLYHNYLQDSGINLLCKGLQDPCCTLKRLSLEDCGLTSSCCDDFRSVLITNRSLIKLNLSVNDLYDSGVKILCEALRHPNCTLQELSLIRCGLTSSSCHELHSVFIINRSLTGLILTGNVLKDSGIKLLCEGIRHPDCTLKELILCACFGTLSSCDDIRSLITKQTLNGLMASLDVGKEISDSEENRYYNTLQSAGFIILKGDGSWLITFARS